MNVFKKRATLPLVLALLVSSSLLFAQNPKKKSKANKKASTTSTKSIPSHRHVVKGKQKEHSKYQGTEETN